MTFEEWQKKEQVLGLDLSALEACRSAYEAGKASSRRPRAFIAKQGNSFLVMKGSTSDLMVTLIRGGFSYESDAKEWARSNGYEV